MRGSGRAPDLRGFVRTNDEGRRLEAYCNSKPEIRNKSKRLRRSAKPSQAGKREAPSLARLRHAPWPAESRGVARVGFSALAKAEIQIPRSKKRLRGVVMLGSFFVLEGVSLFSGGSPPAGGSGVDPFVAGFLVVAGLAFLVFSMARIFFFLILGRARGWTTGEITLSPSADWRTGWAEFSSSTSSSPPSAASSKSSRPRPRSNPTGKGVLRGRGESL